MKVLDYETELKALEDLIRGQSRAGCTLQILEAGCGREWYFDLRDIPHEVTGVDLDSQALQHRISIKGGLHRFFVGDLCTVDLPPSNFDVVYCSFVLEHLPDATRALDNFVKWLKPGGMLIVRVPDVNGVQTFLAKLLPRWCAILYYRLAWGIKDAGRPGFAPYPAFYDDVISESGFHHFCADRNLKIVDEIRMGSYTGRGKGALRYLVPMIAKLISVASGGRVQDQYVDRTFVALKDTSMVRPLGQARYAGAR